MPQGRLRVPSPTENHALDRQPLPDCVNLGAHKKKGAGTTGRGPVGGTPTPYGVSLRRGIVQDLRELRT